MAHRLSHGSCLSPATVTSVYTVCVPYTAGSFGASVLKMASGAGPWEEEWEWGGGRLRCLGRAAGRRDGPAGMGGLRPASASLGVTCPTLFAMATGVKQRLRDESVSITVVNTLERLKLFWRGKPASGRCGQRQSIN